MEKNPEMSVVIYLVLFTDIEPYIEELISKVEAETTGENIRQLLIPRRKLNIGDMLGKGKCFAVSRKIVKLRG